MYVYIYSINIFTLINKIINVSSHEELIVKVKAQQFQHVLSSHHESKSLHDSYNSRYIYIYILYTWNILIHFYNSYDNIVGWSLMSDSTDFVLVYLIKLNGGLEDVHAMKNSTEINLTRSSKSENDDTRDVNNVK